MSKPGTASMELDRVRKERDALIEENKKLKQLMNEDSAGPTSGNAKYLKNKVRYLFIFKLCRYSTQKRHWHNWKKKDLNFQLDVLWLKNN